MALRFRKSLGLMKGGRLNLGLNGPSIRVGMRGLGVTFGRTGTRLSAGLPGTGLSYSTLLQRPSSTSTLPPPPKRMIEDPDDATLFGEPLFHKDGSKITKAEMERVVRVLGWGGAIAVFIVPSSSPSE